MLGGKRVDRVRDAQRIREIQDLLREIAGDVDDNEKEMAQVKAMMKARTAPVPPPVTPVPAPPEAERPKAVPPPYQQVPPREPVTVPRMTPPQTPPPMPQAPPAREKPVFCIHCGSRLPPDGFGCPVCASRNTRICPNCGTRVNVSTVSCPVCRRVMPPVMPYNRH